MPRKPQTKDQETLLAEAARNAFNHDGWNADEAYEVGWINGRIALRAEPHDRRGGVSDGIERIAAERARQISVEGFTPEHDEEEHPDAELVGAGAAYATLAFNQVRSGYDLLGATPAQTFRWAHEAWKPSADPIRNLEKAGALIAAEIDRLIRERAAPPETPKEE